MARGKISDLQETGGQGAGAFVGVCRRQSGAGETPEAALRRECREELDVEVKVGEKFFEVTHAYPDLTVHLTLFSAEIVSGEPKLLEHEDARWIAPSEIGEYAFCPADEDILREIERVFSKRPQDPIVSAP